MVGFWTFLDKMEVVNSRSPLIRIAIHIRHATVVWNHFFSLMDKGLLSAFLVISFLAGVEYSFLTLFSSNSLSTYAVIEKVAEPSPISMVIPR